MNENNVQFLKEMMDKEFLAMSIILKEAIDKLMEALKTKIKYEMNRQMLIEMGILKNEN